MHMLEDHEGEFVDALSRDLQKPRFETVYSELMPVKNEAIYAINNLKKWMEPEPVERNLTTSLDDCFVVREPLGVVLIVGAWNSPVQLCLVPLIGAIAAGNCVITNPSEICSHTAELLHRLLPSYLDNSREALLSVLVFPGSSADGRKVMQAAARTLTPVTLVLGGKNPCYVDRDCDMGIAARRIAWARFLNSGQSMAAPDYVLCHTEVRERLVQALSSCLLQFYGPEPRQSSSYGRLVNAEHFALVRDLLQSSGKVAVGGQVNEAERYIVRGPLPSTVCCCEAPTVLIDVLETDPAMQQEILGPILPVMTVDSADEALAFINQKPKPLCLYVYSSNSKVISQMMTCTSSGSFCSNDSTLQSMMVTLPFGGVGSSGMGSYHGRYSFETFSNKKSCVLRSTRIECITYLRYPPYEDRSLSLMTWASSMSRKGQGWCQIL
ncbi:AL3B1 dehydrogenase, partial [Amia calva]|nr:AL3B1 dehydrogenase [Amia calva]